VCGVVLVLFVFVELSMSKADNNSNKSFFMGDRHHLQDLGMKVVVEAMGHIVSA
jgi:hypothetical protein